MKHQNLKLIISIIVLFFLVSCAATPTKEQIINADYGHEVLPKDCVAIAEQTISKNLKDPLSVQFRHNQCSKGYWNSVPIMGLSAEFGYLQQGEANAKNSFGAYVGFRPYKVLIKNGYAIRHCIFSKDGICIPSTTMKKHNTSKIENNTISDGYNVYIWKNNNKYEGNWLNGKPHGHGIITGIDGTRYKGNWVNGKANGNGTKTWASGGKYEGNFTNDKIDGYGIKTNADGAIYKGDWKNDKPHGYGVVSWVNGNKFEGNYIEGVRSGYGIMIYANGDMEKGNWVNSKCQNCSNK